jgi:hypothetical protein
MKLGNTLALALLASSAALTAAPAASAATFGGFIPVVSLPRSVATVTQSVNASDIVSMPIAVTMCNGANEFPWFVVRSATVAEAVGSCYTIRATVVTANRVRLEMNHTGGGNGISSVKFGGAGSVIGFDRTNPNPGTAGSSTGRDVTFRPSVGAWTLRASYSQPLGLGMTPPVGDVYGYLALSFSSCFDVGDFCHIELDLDKAN